MTARQILTFKELPGEAQRLCALNHYDNFLIHHYFWQPWISKGLQMSPLIYYFIFNRSMLLFNHQFYNITLVQQRHIFPNYIETVRSGLACLAILMYYLYTYLFSQLNVDDNKFGKLRLFFDITNKRKLWTMDTLDFYFLFGPSSFPTVWTFELTWAFFPWT